MGTLYGRGLEIPNSYQGAIFALMRLRDEKDPYKVAAIDLEWSPRSAALPPSMESGTWRPVILPPISKNVDRRLSLAGPPGMSVEFTPILMMK
jgi:hypothetical protein